MFEELGPDLVDAVLVPTSRGDLIWGLFEGFRQLKAADLTTAVPRLFAVEPFARISAVLGGETVTGSFPGTTKLTSIRSDERRVGKECVSTCRSRWSPYHEKKKHKSKHKTA